MSTAPENEFDLEKLFLPAWAQESSAQKYSKYEGEEPSDRRDDRRGFRPQRRDRPREGGRRDDRGPRPQRRQDGPPRGERRGGPQDRSAQPGQGPRPGFRRGDRGEPRREAPAPLPEVDV